MMSDVGTFFLMQTDLFSRITRVLCAARFEGHVRPVAPAMSRDAGAS